LKKVEAHAYCLEVLFFFLNGLSETVYFVSIGFNLKKKKIPLKNKKAKPFKKKKKNLKKFKIKSFKKIKTKKKLHKLKTLIYIHYFKIFNKRVFRSNKTK
jgi:hypothetical protein